MHYVGTSRLSTAGLGNSGVFSTGVGGTRGRSRNFKWGGGGRGGIFFKKGGGGGGGGGSNHLLWSNLYCK